jgi:hypothetical protein
MASAQRLPIELDLQSISVASAPAEHLRFGDRAPKARVK